MHLGGSCPFQSIASTPFSQHPRRAPLECHHGALVDNLSRAFIVLASTKTNAFGGIGLVTFQLKRGKYCSHVFSACSSMFHGS